ncbi:hypothetical protein AaE_014757 [Aphanomyces astaci]|uniref:Ion transport domain-containing protein n=1 Tax=Aphanomyces astaci TaxID=112090 RepID=A0A6A4Z4Q7_APHAT|nr:hypothetical protein AaE_014757 [Aphanomyces astaci]
MFATASAMADEGGSGFDNLSERAMILSRVLERQTRKHTITRRVSLQPIQLPSSVTASKEKASSVVTPVLTTTSIIPDPAPVRTLSRGCGTNINVAVTRRGGIWSYRQRLWRLFHDATSSLEAKYLSIFILTAVAVSIIVYIIQSQPDLSSPVRDVLTEIEHTCIYIFSLDFSIRLVCTPHLKAFLLDAFNWVDFVSVLPFYLEFVVDMVRHMVINVLSDIMNELFGAEEQLVGVVAECNPHPAPSPSGKDPQVV